MRVVALACLVGAALLSVGSGSQLSGDSNEASEQLQQQWAEAQLVEDLAAEMASPRQPGDGVLMQTGEQSWVYALSEQSFQNMLNSHSPLFTGADGEVDEAEEAEEGHEDHADFLELETESLNPVGSGHKAGSSGGSSGSSGGSSGSSGGSSGSSGGSSGSSGGSSGSSGGSSGSSGGSSGSSGGSSGSSGGSSGSSGGSSGSSGGSSGSSGGSSGSSGGSSGSSGGSSGSSGGSSGASGKVSASSGGSSASSGGSSGSSNGSAGLKTVVQPVKNVGTYYPSFKLERSYVKPEQTIAWQLYRMYLRRYGFGTGAKSTELIKSYDREPLDFMKATNVGPAWKATQAVYARIVAHKEGKHFVNPVVSTQSSSIREQLQCGSCWAQAAVGSFEVALRKRGQSPAGRLSVQQLVDCVTGKLYPDTTGCSGGTPMDALRYLRTHGLALESEYSYTGRQGACRDTIPGAKKGRMSFGWEPLHFTAASIRSSKRDYSPCSTAQCAQQWQFEADILLSVESDGPYVAWVDASNWQRYRKGVFPPTECKNTLESGNHVVELLGYGSENGVPFWLVKNSWGPTWGEGGFIKLPIGHNACGLINYIGRAAPNAIPVKSAPVATKTAAKPAAVTVAKTAPGPVKPKKL